MAHSIRFPALFAATLAVLLAGCVTPSAPLVQRNPKAVAIQRAPTGAPTRTRR